MLCDLHRIRRPKKGLLGSSCPLTAPPQLVSRAHRARGPGEVTPRAGARAFANQTGALRGQGRSTTRTFGPGTVGRLQPQPGTPGPPSGSSGLRTWSVPLAGVLPAPLSEGTGALRAARDHSLAWGCEKGVRAAAQDGGKPGRGRGGGQGAAVLPRTAEPGMQPPAVRRALGAS